MGESPTNFFSEYRVLNSNTEIPPLFTVWCALSAVSGALGRRVWLDMGTYTIYPNMYIVLVAGSGRMRKSTAIGITRRLLESLSPPPNLIAQKITTEALFEAMARQSPTVGKVVVGGNGKHLGQGFVITDELTNFLTKHTLDSGIGGLLIEFFDCRDRVKYQTKSRGEEHLHDTQLSILAGTTPEELRKAIPEEAIGSGLASRILFVYTDTPCPPVAFPTYTPRQHEAQEWCKRFLSRAATLSGPVVLGEEAKEWCVECYNKRCHTSKLFEDPHLRGYASRRYDHLFKLAMALAVGFTETIELSVSILTRAEELLIQTEHHLQRVVQLVTMSDKGHLAAQVLAHIVRAGALSREDLMASLSHRIDGNELTMILDTLRQSGQVSIDARGGKIMCVFVGKAPK